MILQNVRVDWVHVASVDSYGNYSLCAMLPKDSEAYKQFKAARDAAIAAGVAKQYFRADQVDKGGFKGQLGDGDKDDKPDHYKGHYYINFKSKVAPGLVNKQGELELNPHKFYSGCYVHLDCSIYPFNNVEFRAKGIGYSFDNVMFVEDGPRLDGRPTPKEATEAFKNFVAQEPTSALEDTEIF